MSAADADDVEVASGGMRKSSSVDTLRALASGDKFGHGILEPGLLISCKEVSYTVPDRADKTKTISLLNNVTCVFSPNRVSALMGPSGAGKTTLLDVLAGRKTQGTTTGKVTMAGQSNSKDITSTICSYVEQFDTLLGALTVREMLLYQAELKTGGTANAQTEEHRAAMVEELLDQLGLNTCADVLIGNELARGISGGQAKRTNIGIALVTKPRVLFLDEPTSGLDSATSTDVMSIVRGLANAGITCVSTIHSPTPDAFRLFDDLVLLSKGKLAYAGSLFGNFGAVPFFEGIGFAYDSQTNLADHLINCISDKHADSKDVDISGKFEASDWSKHLYETVHKEEAKLESGEYTKLTDADVKKLASSKSRAIVSVHAIKTLLKYRTRSNYKDGDYVAARVSGPILFGLVMMSLYWGQGDKSGGSNGEQLNTAALMFMVATLPSFGAAGYMPSIVMERPLFYREMADGCYGVYSYLIYKLIEEGFLAIFPSLVSQGMIYGACALRGSFLIFWLSYYCILQNGIALAYVVSAVAPNMDAANTLLPVYNVVALFFGGILMRRDDMPDGWRWYSHTLFVRYGWQAMMLNHFNNIDKLPETWGEEGPTILKFYDVSPTSISVNFGFMILTWFVWLALAGYFFSTVRHVKR